jgi:putative DNA primase/helicase
MTVGDGNANAGEVPGRSLLPRESVEKAVSFYAEHKAGIAWTAANVGDDAKRVRASWDKEARAPVGEFGWECGQFASRMQKRNPVWVLNPKGDANALPVVGVDCDSWPDVEHALSFGLPKTLTAQSSKGKRHMYYRAPEDAGVDLWKIEFGHRGIICSGNGYFIAPPALHPGGWVYRFLWEEGGREIATLPGEIYWEIRKAAGQFKAKARDATANGAKVREGSRNNTMIGLAGHLRGVGVNEDAGLAALLEINRYQFEPPLEESVVAGMVERNRRSWDGASELDEFSFPESPFVPEPEKPRVRPSFKDEEFADHVIRAYNGKIRWDRDTGQLIVFKNGRFHEVAEKEVRETVLKLMRSVFDDYAADLPEDDPYREEAEKFVKTRAKVAFANPVVSVIGPRVPISNKDLNTNPDIFAAGDGKVVDLKTFEVRDGGPGDLVTLGTDVPWVPDAQCPLWEAHIEKVTLGDKDYAAYLKRMFGYTLTGHVGEQKLWIALGGGGNGKGVTFTVPARVLGELSDEMSFATITQTKQARDGSAATPDLACLPGKRFVFCDENEREQKLNDARIKSLTGKTALKVRANYGHPFSFMPQFKLALLCNYPPKMDTTTAAAQRRIVVLPFEAFFSPEDGSRINDFDDMLFEQEAPGILRWMIEGLRDYYAYGKGALEPSSCAVIQLATTKYLDESNILYEAIDEGLLVIEKGETAEWTDIRNTLVDFWMDKGTRVYPDDDISDALRSLGCVNVRVRGVGARRRLWRNVRLGAAKT